MIWLVYYPDDGSDLFAHFSSIGTSGPTLKRSSNAGYAGRRAWQYQTFSLSKDVGAGQPYRRPAHYRIAIPFIGRGRSVLISQLVITQNAHSTWQLSFNIPIQALKLFKTAFTAARLYGCRV
jgi:hypothetical protein